VVSISLPKQTPLSFAYPALITVELHWISTV